MCNIDPREGTKVTADTTVRLYVSKGAVEDKITVPDVINKPLSIAKNELVAAGFKVVENIIYEESDKSKDTVISTDPLPGVNLPKDSKIKITASSGKKEKTIDVKIKLPAEVKNKVEIESYIDGSRYSSDTVIPSEKKEHVIKVTGTNGTKEITVRINDLDYKKYRINFGSNKCEEIRIEDKYSKSLLSNSSDKITSSEDENREYESEAENLSSMLNFLESIFEGLEV